MPKRTTKRRAARKSSASSTKITRRVEEWPLDRLRANPHNAKVHPEDQLERLVESIQRFGFITPVAAREDGEILAGHARVEAARRAGLERVTVRVVDHLTPEESRLFAIGDNRIAELSEWNFEALAAEIAELRELGLDVEAAGFSEGELDDLIRKLEAAGTIERAVVDDEEPDPAAPPRPVVSRLGDTWVLGDHRLTCGDSRSASTWLALMSNDEPAACVHTDPPYGVSYRTEGGERVRNDDLVGNALSSLIADAFVGAIEHARPGAAWYVWHANGQVRTDVLFGMQAAGLVELQVVVWAKPSPNLGRADYQRAHESCFYAVRDGHRPKWHGGRDQGDVWRIGVSNAEGTRVVLGPGLVITAANGAELALSPVAAKDKRRRRIRVEHGRPLLLAQGDREGDLWEVARDRVTEHATPKPVELVTKALVNSTLAGEIVLDPFAGGGSTLMACERSGRRCRAIELEPAHVDTIVRRWERVTERRVTLFGDPGKAFADVAAARVGA